MRVHQSPHTKNPSGNLDRTVARLIPRFKRQRIGVVGDVMLDRYLWGTASRLSPEAAVPVVNFVEQSECLGGAGNVAANLVALGAQAGLFGVIGDDEPAAAVRECLKALGLSDKGVLADAGRTTTVKTRIIARHQQVVRVDHEKREPLGKEIEERLIRRVKANLPNLSALVVSDYDKGVVTDALAERVLSACHELRVPAFVKPKTSRLFAYRGARAIVCNRHEAAFYVQRSSLSDDQATEQAGPELLARFGCSAAVVTLGEKGMAVFEEGAAKPFHIPATSFEVTYARVGLPGLSSDATGRQVFDVTGAGDTVLSTLALAVAAGASLREAAMLANAAAGVVVGKLGTATVSPPELRAAVREIS